VPPVVSIDVVLPAAMDAEPTEFERATALIKPILVGQGQLIQDQFPLRAPPTGFLSPLRNAEIGGLRAGDLVGGGPPRYADLSPEAIVPSDVAFIVRETELDAEVVLAWAESARWTKDALSLLEGDADPQHAAAIGSTGWAFFYCVLRDLVVSDLDGILARGMASWESQQTLGEELRRIPAQDAVQRKQLLEALLLLARLARINWRRPSPTALARVLAEAPLSRPVALHALDIFDEHGIEQPDAYQVLTEVYPDEKEPIGCFIQALRLRTAIGPDPRIALAVAREVGDVPDPLVSLAAWNVDRWRKVVAEVGSDTGPLEPEPTHSRAIEHQLRVERILPLPALKARLADLGDSPLDPVVAKLEPMLDEFSEQAHSLLQGKPAVIGPAGPMPTEAAAVVQNLGRFLGLGLTLQGGLGLIDNGIPSPGAAMTYGPDVLKQILFDQYPLTIITSLTRNIQLTANAANGFVHNIITDWHSGYWFGTSDGTPVTPQAAENAPTLQGLFGNLDDCACRPCESVLSLSAYLVDLLNLLKTVPKTGTTGSVLQTAQSELRVRRPDIFRLDLGCEAAEAEVLHIDLAIGVMEAELGTAPAQQLTSAPYPWSLPFDRGFAELQPTCTRLGLARSSLLALTASPPAADVAAATLGIAQTQSGATLSEWLLITTPRSGNDLADAWGVPRGATTTITDPDSGAALTGSLPAVLGRASVLLERSGLELDALDAVLATRYVGGLALGNRQQCKVSEMTLAGQPEAVFDRLHRFTRLARKLPAWSVSLVDSALLACALPSMGRQASDYVAALQTLAAAERARIALNLPAEVVLAMRMPLEDIRLGADSRATLFARDFELLATAIAAGGSVTSNIDLVAGSLGCDSRELAMLVATTPKPDQIDDTLNSTSLTWLYRHVRLARALQVTVPQLFQLKLMTGIDPFEAASAMQVPQAEQAGFERLTALHEAAERVQVSGWSIGMLADLLFPASELAKLANRSAGLDISHLAQPANVTALLSALQAILRESTAKVRASQSAALVEELLQPWIGNEAAARVLTSLAAASEAPVSGRVVVLDSAAAALLSAPTRADYAPDNVAPLFDAGTATGLLTPNTGVTTVLTSRLATLRNRLAERERERQLVAHVQATTALPQEVVTQLLTSDLVVVAGGGATSAARQALLADAFWRSVPADSAPPSVDEVARPDLHEWMVRLHKLASLVRSGGGDVTWLRLAAYVRSPGATVSGINWSSVIAPRQVAVGTTWAPRWSDWVGCVDLRALLIPASLAPETCTSHFQRMTAGSGTVADAELQPLCLRLGVSTDELRALAVLGLSSTTREALAIPTAIRRLVALSQLLGTAGATAAQATRTLATNANADAAQVVRQLAQAQGTSTSTLAQIADGLRKQQRDALVAALLVKKGWRDVNRVYEHCLIDPQVQPCLSTTATLQAVAAVQQFIQRVLYGLEAGFPNVQELRQRWSWMRSYRVWEANRKVFLFPENWLFPELRDDKSSSFRLLESALGQGELNDERAREAFGAFLDDVAQMGQVQVLGMFEDVQYDNSSPAKRVSRVLHCIARSPNPPYNHYIRRCDSFGSEFSEWTPWERVELDIQGDHVMPFMRSGSLHLVWPVVRRASAAGLPEGATEVRLHWSRQVGRQWQKPSISRDASTYAYSPFRDERNGFAFRLKRRSNTPDADVEVICYVAKTRLESDPPPMGITRSEGERFREFPTQRPAAGSSKLMYFPYSGAPFRAGDEVWPPEYAEPGQSASRTTSWVCWVKVKAAAGSGWMQLTQQANVTATLRDDAGIGGPIPLGSSEIWMGFGGIYGANSQRIAQNAYVAPSIWRAHLSITSPVARSFTSGPVSTPRVDPGIREDVFLTMLIDASQYTPEELGLEYDGLLTYEAEKTFVIDSSNGIELENAFGRLLGPSDVRPWMNGFQEKNLDRVEKELFLEGIHADAPLYGTQVFAPGNAGTFYALPSNANRLAWEEPTVWFYSEAGGSCFVDLAPGETAAGARVAVVPASYPEANRIAAAWRAQGNITDTALQAATYGAERLPRAGNAVRSELLRRTNSGSVDTAAQVRLSFDRRLPNACYQWEIFFHAPLLIADQLSKQQRFEEAESWLRFVFDPISGGNSNDPKRFLKFQVFKDLDPRSNVTSQLTLLAQVASLASTGDAEAVKRLIARWRELPFRPFVIARRRHIAFLWQTVFAYLDNLLAWADSLYRRDTRESIGEATLLYVLVARILGPRPKLREKGSQRPARTYDSVQGQWDDFGNLWVDTRIDQLHLIQFGEPQCVPSADGFLFFCLPNNDKLSTYWNMVESRLFNIRHCRNIEGINRQLPLTDPPIDPELLIRATAAGLDLGQVIAGLYAPPPHYRFSVLAARASELAAETRTLGGALLAAIEKRDAERLSQMRSANELAMLERVEAVRRLQIEEAEANLESLRATRTLTETRYQQYQRLLGRETSAAPAIGATSGDESMLGRVQTGASAASGLGLIEQEDNQIEYLGHAYDWSVAASVVKGVGAASHMSASIAAASGIGAFGVEVLKSAGSSLSITGDMFDLVSRGWQHGANQGSLMAGHYRRRDDWAFQSNQALRELRQIDRQMLANEIRISLAKKELENQQLQIEQTQAIDDFLHDKYSNADLYDWMVQQLSAAHFTAYNLARELAMRAQAAAVRELGGAPLNVIGRGHWDGLRSGLLAGERLHQEVKRLEVTYLERNVREHEMTKHVSLRRLDPKALVALRLDRACDFELPEWLFDLDAPGHYARRLKSVSLSVPCVVGPYGVVNCKLILLGTRTRVSVENVQNTTSYLATTSDARFDVRYGAAESIFTSSGRDDSGLFETSLRDERFLPFEGAGAISRWRLELPGSVPQFDYDTISDVILHLRYTARDGGESMRDSAKGQFPHYQGRCHPSQSQTGGLMEQSNASLQRGDQG